MLLFQAMEAIVHGDKWENLCYFIFFPVTGYNLPSNLYSRLTETQKLQYTWDSWKSWCCRTVLAHELVSMRIIEELREQYSQCFEFNPPFCVSSVSPDNKYKLWEAEHHTGLLISYLTYMKVSWQKEKGWPLLLGHHILLKNHLKLSSALNESLDCEDKPYSTGSLEIFSLFWLDDKDLMENNYLKVD